MFIDCLLCENFCTTIENEKQFDDYIALLDKEIKNLSENEEAVLEGTFKHDFEDLKKKKELCLLYKLKIEELKYN